MNMNERKGKRYMKKEFLILIPVYREPKEALRNIKRILLNDFKDLHIVVAIDGELNDALKEFIAELEKLKDKRLSVRVNGERLGKVETLNRTVKACLDKYKPETLVFFDNDVLIHRDRSFFSKLKEEMEDADIIEFPKEPLPRTLFGKIVGFDFIFASLVTSLISKLLRRSPFLNGAGFAIKTEAFLRLGMFPHVPYEDFELATQAYRMKMRFKMPISLKIYNEPPENLKEWINQKKRWAVEFVNWSARFLFGKDVTSLSIFLDSILVFYMVGTVLLIPAAVSFGVFGAVSRSEAAVQILMLLLLTLHTTSPTLWMFFTFHQMLMLSKGIITYIAGLTVSTVMMLIYTRLTRMKFNLPAYLAYYVLYTPFAALAYITLITIDSFGFKMKYDWKV